MEIIKKTILRVMTTGATTTENTYAIIPDIDAVYNIKINLSSDVRDIGFFDAFVETFQPYSYYGDGEPIGLGNLL